MPKNKFYSEYDTETLGGSRTTDYRTPFQVDRDRIIYSSAFRKLQAKTQVYLSGEYDFYRTRLTHSIEVAQIGRSICEYLATHSDFLNEGFRIDADLVEACCLSHDLGHPPFGHAGEKALHEQFKEYGGFEGNAQTLRLISDTLYQGKKGISPTRAFMDSVLKYKSLYSEMDDPENHFLYDDQLAYRDFVFQANGELVGKQAAGAFDGLSSIECQIMDWADDTAYCLNDILDGVKAGFVSIDRLEKWAAKVGLDGQTQPLFEALLGDLRKENLEAIFGVKIGKFIQACRLMETKNAMSAASNRYAFKLFIDPQAKVEANFYKKIALDLIFRAPPLQQMEFKGVRILDDLYSSIEENYFSGKKRGLVILPDSVAELLEKESSVAGKAWRVRDYLAGLTDGLAMRTHKRLYDPGYGSIIDLE